MQLFRHDVGFSVSGFFAENFKEMKTKIFVVFRGKEHSVAWYSGTSDAAIRETIKDCLGIPPENNVILHDEDGVFVAINQYLPNKLKFFAEQRTSMNESGGGSSSGGSSSGGKGDSGINANNGNSFRGELLKFERINAHLANERTWLAWVRTALSCLSCAFAFLSISSSGLFSTLTYLLGALFCLAVLIIYVTGWLRYNRVKTILGLSFTDM